jgi:hypothetical protein
MNMKKWVAALAAMLVLPLVFFACAGLNQPPVAYIDSITPSSPQQGQAVALAGHGTDADGQVIGWQWRSSIDGTLGNSSSINTDTLSAGQHTIYFKVCDDDGDCSAEATANLIVTAVQTEVTAQSAADAVVENVIEPMGLDGPVIGFKLDHTLKPGDTFGPCGGDKRQVDQESYFFFIDLHPNAYYAHDVLFALVSRGTGQVNVSPESWWPILNDEPPDWVSDEDEYWDVSHWFYDRDIVRPTGIAGDPSQVGQPPPQHQWLEASVVVSGWYEGEMLEDDMATSVSMMHDLFDDLVTPGHTYEIGPYPSGANRPADVLALLEDVCSDGYDHITVYMVGHGDIDSIKLGGILMDVEDLVDFVSDHPDTSFTFLLESCHIGSLIDDLKELSNVYLVLTATSTLFSAYGDIDPDSDPNPEDTGAEWTSGMYAGILEQTAGDGWGDIVNESNRIDTPPSVVLFLAAFNNEGPTDSRDLDAAYIEGREFPQAWSPWGRFCNLWEVPPPGADAEIQLSISNSGWVTSEGGGTSLSSRMDYYLYLGRNDTERAFMSFAIPEDMPAGSAVLAANIKGYRSPSEGCQRGDHGDMVIEHLNYGGLDAGDFAATAAGEEASIALSVNHCLVGGVSPNVYLASVKSSFQQDFDNHLDYSQYRARYSGSSGLRMSGRLIIYYEVR